MAELSTNVRYIKGIGETRAKALEKLGITTLRDLIGYLRGRYQHGNVNVLHGLHGMANEPAYGCGDPSKRHCIPYG